MPLLYLLPEPSKTSPPSLAAADRMIGRDIRFESDFEIGPNGDYLLVESDECVRQSVVNEARTGPGELASVPDYGFGMAAAVRKPATKSTRDTLANRIRLRLRANPRIQATNEVSAARNEDTGALVATVRVVAAGREMRSEITVEPTP
jgi:phage baseplate assembly protein W